MTKKELIGKVQDAYLAPGGRKLTKEETEGILDVFGDVAAAELLGGGGEVPLPGLGKLKAVRRAAREGRNPRTGATIQVPAKTAVKFSMTKGLKEAMS